MKKRNELPNFYKVPHVNVDTEKLLSCFKDLNKDEHDQLYYKCGVHYTNDEYKQMYVTYPTGDEKIRDRADERLYTNLQEEFKGTYVEEVLNMFKSPYTRTRLVVKKPGAYILPHIDYDTSYSVRYFITLKTNPWSYVAIKRKGEDMPEIKHLPADGSAYFVNVGQLHSAWNFGKEDHVSLIVSVNGQDDLENVDREYNK
jgi:hypothetical protein